VSGAKSNRGYSPAALKRRRNDTVNDVGNSLNVHTCFQRSLRHGHPSRSAVRPTVLHTPVRPVNRRLPRISRDSRRASVLYLDHTIGGHRQPPQLLKFQRWSSRMDNLEPPSPARFRSRRVLDTIEAAFVGTYRRWSMSSSCLEENLFVKIKKNSPS